MICEHVDTLEVACGFNARWLVRVGSRKMDGQYSCGIHLSATCSLMLRAEERDGATLTVARA
jgi:hypothetical protein